MTATAHAIVGTLLAARFTDPVAALPLALGSHYLTDMVPHWDSGTNRKQKSEKGFIIEAIIDGIVAIIVSFLIYYYVFGLTNFFYLYLVVGFSVLPDVVTMFTRFIFKKKNPLWNWNNRLQSKLNQKLQLPWGILTQIVVIGAIYILLFRIFI
jgi:hypothetical protein